MNSENNLRAALRESMRLNGDETKEQRMPDDRRNEIRRDDDIARALHDQQIDQEIKALKDQVASLASDREKALRWGIMVLGAAVLAMASWIFNFITTGHIK